MPLEKIKVGSLAPIAVVSFFG